MRTNLRILLVEDDRDTRRYLLHALKTVGGFEVVTVGSPRRALEVLDDDGGRWDLLLTDLRLPGITGVELIDEVRLRVPGLPALVMTAHPSLDSAVGALRSGAVDYLLKPLSVDQVLTAVRAAVKPREPGERVLAIGAHPDDVEIGVGGALALHVARGDDVTIMTLSQGAIGGDAEERATESERAARSLGARLILGDLVDTRIPEAGVTVDLIEQVVRDLRPDIVYVHSAHDVHQDHRAVHAAARIAARGVPSFYCYQSPSATVDFRPTRFVPIDDGLEAKLEAISAFRSQVATRDYLEEDLLRANARYWSRYGTSDYAEPLEVVRDEPRRAPGSSVGSPAQRTGTTPASSHDTPRSIRAIA